MGKIFSNLICALASVMLFASCGTMKVYVNTDSTYSRQNPITIANLDNDPAGFIGELKFQLQSNGYKLMSYEAAKKSIEYDSSTEDSSYHSELNNVTYVNSAYVLTLSYNCYYDVLYWCITSLSATITDLVTGETIMSAAFHGEKGCNGVVSDLVRQMNTYIK